MSNPLGDVWDWYEMARDGLRITLRVVEKKIPGAITRKHALHGLSASDSAARIKKGQQELDNMAVVAMAVFERSLRDHLADIILNHLPSTDPFDAAVKARLKDNIEFWNLTSQLVDEIFKTRVAADLCGMVKQVILFRNQVAHGHAVDEKPPKYADPFAVYQRLTSFLRGAGILQP